MKSAPAQKPAATRRPKPRGRRRSVRAESAILAATTRLLAKKPLRDITADAIAQQAGVSKATLYKWWPSKCLVALDAFLKLMETEVPTPDTGSVERDFTEQLKSVVRFYTRPQGHMFRQFIAEGQFNPDFLEEFNKRFLRVRRDSVLVMWRRGVARGEVPAEFDEEIAIDLIYGPSLFRLLSGHSALDEKVAAAMISAAFRGLKCRPSS